MSELRFDLTTNDWVIFAPSRALRPHHPLSPLPAPAVSPTPCPFCPGNEAFTPPEIYAVRGPGLSPPSNWRVRVVPNKFPALRIEEDTRRIEESPAFSRMGGCGAHEVIVESPDHSVFLGKQPTEQIELVLRTVQLRYQDLMRDRRFQVIIAFKNYGAAAGTSLEHPRWQIIATLVVPRLLRQKAGARRWRACRIYRGSDQGQSRRREPFRMDTVLRFLAQGRPGCYAGLRVGRPRLA